MRVLRINLLLSVGLALLALATPAHAAPISAHAMVHTCCTPDALKERIFAEADALGADYIRVDVELNAIFEDGAGGEAEEPDWDGLDRVIQLAERHDLKVLGILLAPPAYISTCPERWPDAGRCAAADTARFGELAGEVAEYAKDSIRHWEIVNEPDGEWAFEGTPEEYAAMLSAAYDGIKERVPGAQVLMGGLMRPHEPAWLERVFATPGADALNKFDIANVHLRGPVDAVVRRYGEVRSRLAALGFNGPLWVTEHGYPADPFFQADRAYAGGDASQAAYLVQSLVGLGEAGAPQVFVTLRDNLEGEYASEGLVHIGEAPGLATSRRPSFDAVQRLTVIWDRVMAWRAEQREHERLMRRDQEAAAASAAAYRAALPAFRAARLALHAAQRAAEAGPRTPHARQAARVRGRLIRRLADARAVLAGRRTEVLWHRGYAALRRERAREHALAAGLLRMQIAGEA